MTSQAATGDSGFATTRGWVKQVGVDDHRALAWPSSASSSSRTSATFETSVLMPRARGVKVTARRRWARRRSPRSRQLVQGMAQADVLSPAAALSLLRPTVSGIAQPSALTKATPRSRMTSARSAVTSCCCKRSAVAT